MAERTRIAEEGEEERAWPAAAGDPAAEVAEGAAGAGGVRIGGVEGAAAFGAAGAGDGGEGVVAGPAEGLIGGGGPM